MKKFEILNHPADLKIKAYGKDLPEVFVNAALAVARQQAPDIKILGNLDIEKIEIEAQDLQSLLVDWLNEILYRSDTNKKVYSDFKILEFSENPYKIKAKIKGVEVETKNTDIKAVTYHELEIKKVNDNYEAIVIFDI